MISYGNPICPVTENRAIFFCFSQNCTGFAFACSKDCLSEQGHSDHRTALWSDIEEDIRLAIELPITKQELLLLEKQEKQLKIVAEELNTIQLNHERSVRQCKKRLQLKYSIEKVFLAVQNKTTNTVRGSDMARLIKAMENHKLFRNTKAVYKSIQQRNGTMNTLITKLNSLIAEHHKGVEDIIKPELIPTDDPFTFDTANSEAAVVDHGVMTVRKVGGFQPIFAREQLMAGQSYQVEVVQSSYNRSFLIGVATSDLRNKVGQYKSINSFCLSAYNGTLFFDGKQQKNSLTIETGDKVIIRRSAQHIEWIRRGQLLCSASIPVRLRDVLLFPAFWIDSWGSVPAKLQFVND